MNSEPLKGSQATSAKFRRAFHVITRAYNKATRRGEKPALARYTAQAHALLAEPAIPRYYRTRTLLILAKMAGDWVEGLYWHHKADIQFCVMRSVYARGEDFDVDGALDALQDLVDELRDDLVEQAVLDIQAHSDDNEAEATESDDDTESDGAESDDTESDEPESDDIKWDDTESDDSAYQPDDYWNTPHQTQVPATTQPGHQTPQTTNSVQTPCATQALANSTKTAPNPCSPDHQIPRA
jgi:hypothetical protein